MHRTHWLLAILVALVLATGAQAQEDATSVGPPFSEGDVIGFEQLDQIKAYLPEEFWNNRDFFFFEGMQLEVGPAHFDYQPAEAYVKASEKFKGQPRIGPEGSLENYTAGRPFHDFDCKGDPQAGSKVMWNFARRWSGGGGEARFLYTYWDRGEKLPLYYEGTGRGIPMSYRVEEQYLDKQGGDLFRKEKRSVVSGAEVTAPFDARGIKLLTYRYKSSYGPPSQAKNDDTWVYVPTLRRVRRISTSQRTDAISGTDFTLDDLFSFNGIVPQYEWTCLGEFEYIAPGNTKIKGYPYKKDQNYGPYGLSLANDRWEVRKMVKVRMKPKNQDHPYSYKDIYLDTQTFQPHYSFAYDQKDELWKIIWHAKRWSEDKDLAGEWYENWDGVDDPRDLRIVGDIIVNVQTGTGNRIEFWDANGKPMKSKAKIRRYIDTGRLTMGR
ncbi:MAG: DUF1329 domain-containing protein [Deltaproteobacteria bacterium]|nr:DUF1329 domain-containing protein [Deltaproteobacteria bacterium]MBW2447689.1 DUF1329 domain-containing protein [Deltaproteobacteria bacterium]